jgi:DNA repair protein RecO (recombination protein O)
MMNARMHCRTEAIVVKSTDYGESDRIVTFYTLEFGKIKGIAKGARKSRRRFPNALEPFTHSQLDFSRKTQTGLDFIEGSDVLFHFPDIRSNLEKTLAASYMVDLTDKFTPEQKKSEASFGLLHDFLYFLENRPFSEAILRFFEIRLLGISGYAPVLDYCLVCKASLDDKKNYLFNIVKGGIVCDTCQMGHADALPASLGTIKTLKMARELDIETMGRLFFTAQTADESRLILGHFIRHILGRELKSLQVLNEISRLHAEKL